MIPHNHQLNKGTAPEDTKYPDQVSEYIHVHAHLSTTTACCTSSSKNFAESGNSDWRWKFSNNSLLYLLLQEYSRTRQLRLKMKIQQPWIHRIVWVIIQCHQKIKKTHGDRVRKHRKEEILQKSSRVHRKRPRSISPCIQMKMMKSLSMSLEPLQILKLLYQCYLFIKDQQPVRKDQQPVRKDQLQVLILVMKTVSIAISTVHRVKTLEEQYCIQISTFEPMLNIGQWRLKHTSMPQEPDNYFSLRQKMDINKTYAIWTLCRVCNDHSTSMRWPITSVAYTLEFQKELTVELEMCWNSVWRLAERQLESRQKGDPVHERKTQLNKWEDITNSLLMPNTWSTDPWLTMKFSILLIWERSNREIKWPEDGCSPSRRTNKGTSSRQRQDGYWEVPGQTEGISTDRVASFHKTWISDQLPNGSQQEVLHFFTLILRQLFFKHSLIVWIVMLWVSCHQKQVILLILLQD